MIKVAVVVFPGSNCDRDMYHALRFSGFDAEYVYDENADLSRFDAIAIPGGFSYGDYLRPGAVAARERISESIKKESERGKLIFGVCNGFQILVEMGLLPGALLQNPSGRFICRWIRLRVEDNTTPFTLLYEKEEEIKLPIANGFGRYVKAGNEPRVIFRYLEDINGSDDLIAGISNSKGNILGLMPHPERAYDHLLGGEDGLRFFKSLKLFLEKEGV